MRHYCPASDNVLYARGHQMAILSIVRRNARHCKYEQAQVDTPIAPVSISVEVERVCQRDQSDVFQDFTAAQTLAGRGLACLVPGVTTPVSTPKFFVFSRDFVCIASRDRLIAAFNRDLTFFPRDFPHAAISIIDNSRHASCLVEIVLET